nr:DUF3526 domain-containing protein [Lysobacter enzymogenes]
MAGERDALLARDFRARGDLAGSLDKLGSLDYATRMTFLAPELERRLQPLRDRQEGARSARERLSQWAGYLTPPLGMEQALAQLAGTDAQRHRRFERQAAGYQRQLREWFYPRIQRQISAPTPKPRADSYGRMNFLEFDAIPAYAWHDAPAWSRVAGALPTALWLTLLAAALSAWALRRLRQWPAEL